MTEKKHIGTFYTRGKKFATGALLLLLAGACATTGPVTESGVTPTLQNEHLTLQIGERGLEAIHDRARNHTVHLEEEAFHFTLDGREVLSGTPCSRSEDTYSVTFRYCFDSADVEVTWELLPEWHFASKELAIHPSEEAVRIDRVEALRARMDREPSSEYRHYDGRYAAFLRMGEAAASTRDDTDRPGDAGDPGLFFAYQNPFMEWEREGLSISMAYSPDMEWRSEYGPYVADRALVGVYGLSGHSFPVQTVPEWHYVADPEEWLSGSPRMDRAESEAMTDAVEAFLLYNPEESLRIQIGWTVSDYQHDVATEEGREVYKRLIDQTANVGGQHILYTPDHTDLATLEANRDAWGWENILFLNLGQKIRNGEWHPAEDPLPEDVQYMIDYAANREIGLVAYVFPTMPWMQDPEWTAWIDGEPAGYAGIDTGIRSFQDFFLELLSDFYEATGITGYSFDHWWIRYDQPGTTSMYAQWYGTRRILEGLRNRFPDIVLDGRQQYHQTGPWTWLAGSFPHPLASDEQAQSFRSFADLSWSRISSNRQRYAAWWFHKLEFTPNQVMPGYMTHITQRFDGQGHMHRREFRPRDWDYSGWKFSVLASIGTAPVNHVINYIPARDPEEFAAFTEEDQRFFRDWFDWTDQNMETLLNLRPIIGHPMAGRADGTAAFDGDRGFLFLFNPNQRALDAEFVLDGSIGLHEGERFLLREIHPEPGIAVGHPERGIWHYGDSVTIPLEGTEARVFELLPWNGTASDPVLMNLEGSADLQGEVLRANGVRGAVGHEKELSVLVGPDVSVNHLLVNGVRTPFSREGDLISATLQFAGQPFGRAQQVGSYDPEFAGGEYTATFSIPQRILDQLDRNRENWPVTHTEEDLLATWLGPERLLLYVQITDPQEEMEVSMTIDGEPVELKPAFASVYAQPPGQVANVTALSFLGYYAELTSQVEANREYEVTVTLPELEAGRFQGLFFHNLETEKTSRIVR